MSDDAAVEPPFRQVRADYDEETIVVYQAFSPEIAEAAPTAGLSQTSNVNVSDGWVGTRLVAPKSGGRGKR